MTQYSGAAETDPVHPGQPQAPDSRASARHVIDTATPSVETDEVTEAVIMRWVGNDERGRELEVIAIERPDCQLVIHVMPTHYRRHP